MEKLASSLAGSARATVDLVIKKVMRAAAAEFEGRKRLKARVISNFMSKDNYSSW
jgi:hypothetical protein